MTPSTNAWEHGVPSVSTYQSSVQQRITLCIIWYYTCACVRCDCSHISQVSGVLFQRKWSLQFLQTICRLSNILNSTTIPLIKGMVADPTPIPTYSNESGNIKYTRSRLPQIANLLFCVSSKCSLFFFRFHFHGFIMCSRDFFFFFSVGDPDTWEKIGYDKERERGSLKISQQPALTSDGLRLETGFGQCTALREKLKYI